MFTPPVARIVRLTLYMVLLLQPSCSPQAQPVPQPDHATPTVAHDWTNAEAAYNMLPTLMDSICRFEVDLKLATDVKEIHSAQNMLLGQKREYTRTYESYNAIIADGIVKGFTPPSDLPNTAPDLEEMRDKMKVCWPEG